MSKNGLENNLCTYDQVIGIFGGVLAESLKKLDKLQPMEIVRCEDCTHYRVDDDGCRYCHIDGRTINGDDYCSWAERKENERT